MNRKERKELLRHLKREDPFYYWLIVLVDPFIVAVIILVIGFVIWGWFLR